MDADTAMVDLREILSNFEGREYSDPIDRTTMFFGDLGLASIDAVVLGEQLQTRYGQTLPFPAFLAGLAERGAEDLSVGELADFLVSNVADA